MRGLTENRNTGVVARNDMQGIINKSIREATQKGREAYRRELKKKNLLRNTVIVWFVSCAAAFLLGVLFVIPWLPLVAIIMVIVGIIPAYSMKHRKDGIAFILWTADTLNLNNAQAYQNDNSIENFLDAYVSVTMIGNEHLRKDIEKQYQEFIGENKKEVDDFYIWKQDNCLIFADNTSEHIDGLMQRFVESKYDISYIQDNNGRYNIESFRLPIQNIKYYAKEGDVQYTTHVSGGGGGGSSLTGAIVGGLLAGGAGAIIGSRKPVEEIRSYTNEHDTRKTILKYYNGKKFVSETFSIEMYNALEALIPEKEFNVVQMDANNERRIVSPSQSRNGNIKQRIQELHDLKEEGLITDEEYNKKRNDLLNGI